MDSFLNKSNKPEYVGVEACVIKEEPEDIVTDQQNVDWIHGSNISKPDLIFSNDVVKDETLDIYNDVNIKVEVVDTNVAVSDFKASVAADMIIPYQKNKRGRLLQTVPSKKRLVRKAIPALRFDGVSHYPKKPITGKQPPRCHDKQCRRRTRYVCGKCQEPVCPECMESFHTE